MKIILVSFFNDANEILSENKFVIIHAAVKMLEKKIAKNGLIFLQTSFFR